MKEEQISKFSYKIETTEQRRQIDRLLKFKEANRQIRRLEIGSIIGLRKFISIIVNALLGNNILTQKIGETNWIWFIIGILIAGFIIYLIVIIYKLCSEKTLKLKTEEELRNLMEG